MFNRAYLSETGCLSLTFAASIALNCYLRISLSSIIFHLPYLRKNVNYSDVKLYLFNILFSSP